MLGKDGKIYRNEAHWRLTVTFNEAARRRGPDPDVWIKYERETMLNCINSIRKSKGMDSLELSDVERVENMAVGHSDYGPKFALYCSELCE